MRSTLTPTFTWRPGPPPPHLTIVQVYGWLFDQHGRVLVQDTGDRYNLPGGSPEPADATLGDTLIREAMEESQVVVDDTVLLGYEHVCAPGQPPVAMLRMAGRIAAFQPCRPDPDGGRLLGRIMTTLPTAVTLLGWGASGTAQAAAADRVATDRWQLPVSAPTAAAGLGARRLSDTSAP